MKAAENFVFQQAGETGVIVPVGERSLEFEGMVTVNETGALLWQLLQSETDRAALVAALLAEYDVTPEVAERDVDAFLARCKEAGLLAE